MKVKKLYISTILSSLIFTAYGDNINLKQPSFYSESQIKSSEFAFTPVPYSVLPKTGSGISSISKYKSLTKIQFESSMTKQFIEFDENNIGYGNSISLYGAHKNNKRDLVNYKIESNSIILDTNMKYLDLILTIDEKETVYKIKLGNWYE